MLEVDVNEDVTNDFTEDVTNDFTVDVTEDVTNDFTVDVTVDVTNDFTEDVRSPDFITVIILDVIYKMTSKMKSLAKSSLISKNKQVKFTGISGS